MADLGLNLGMSGAALATIIGQIVSGALAIGYLMHGKTVTIRRENLRIKWENVTRIASLGMAPCSNQVAMMVVQIIMNQSLKHYGSHSIYGENIPIACAGIITKVNMIFMSFVIGLSQGLQPIASFNYGAGKKGRVKEAYIKAISIGAVLAVIAFLMFQFFPRQNYFHFRRWFRTVLSVCNSVFSCLFVFYICQFYAADYVEFFHSDWQT